MAAESTTFTVSYKVNASLLLSAAEVLYLYLTDIPVRGLNGEKMGDASIEEKVLAAVEIIENELSIKLPKQKVSEKKDFIKEEFISWGYISSQYLVMSMLTLQGRLNNYPQMTYPPEWLSVKTGFNEARNIYIIPAGTGSSSIQLTGYLFSGSFPLLLNRSQHHLPNYWYLEYVTGWDKVPMDLLQAVGKLVAIQVMAVLGDVAFGAGIASVSLGLDGLSQSIGTTQSAENSLYSARIKQYANELKEEKKGLKQRYGGIPMVSA